MGVSTQKRPPNLGRGVLGLAVLVFAAAAAAQLPGDVNCDGIADAADLATIEAALFSEAPPDCSTPDANGDGVIASADVVTLAQALLQPPAPGPVITFLGLASADGAPVTPLGSINGAAVYFRTSGSGFRVVVEGQTGLSNVRAGTSTFNPENSDLLRRPDIQIESSTALGDGNPALCDGGVPAIIPPDFGSGQNITDALNDVACDTAVATSPTFACTQDEFGVPTFLTAAAQLQFCLQVTRTLALPVGETVLNVQLRDVVGNVGPQRRLIVRVGSGPVPPTFTPSPTFTPLTVRSTATPTITRTPVPPTPSPTRSPVTPTRSAPPQATSTATRTGNPTLTVTRTPSATHPSPTPTLSGPRGPVITFFGLTRADDTLADISATTPDHVPIYARPSGNGFSIVVEGKPGASGVAVGCSSYQTGAAPRCGYQGDSPLPDLQIEASRPLGNGSSAVCDNSGTNAGGVPAINPPSFDLTDTNVGAINDLGCRFVDGQGAPLSRAVSDACVLFSTGEFDFVSPQSSAQFCGFIGRVIEVPPGDTVLTARLRDTEGNVGPPAQLIVRIPP